MSLFLKYVKYWVMLFFFVWLLFCFVHQILQERTENKVRVSFTYGNKQKM